MYAMLCQSVDFLLFISFIPHYFSCYFFQLFLLLLLVFHSHSCFLWCTQHKHSIEHTPYNIFFIIVIIIIISFCCVCSGVLFSLLIYYFIYIYSCCFFHTYWLCVFCVVRIVGLGSITQCKKKERRKNCV